MRMIRRMHPRLIAAAVALIALPLFSVQALAQIAAGQSKFLGSTVHSTPPELKWTTYWNQETPENDGKWGSVEATQGVFTFTNLDADYNFAIANGFKFKFHNLVWGAQQPSWLTSLSQAQQLAAVQTWISTVGARYPKTWAVDVVNEPIHTPPSYMAALGGSGTTGWDWVINAFTMARAAFPNSMLLINEFGTEQEPTTRATYLQIVALLKARGLIDGIGVQGHYFNLDNMSPTDVQTALDSYATAGLPVYISELDMTGQGSASGTDAGQLAEFQSLFPVIWNHPAVQGVTTWGYIVGQTWHTGTGLLNTDGTERPALTWLKGFVAGTTQLAIAATPATLNIVAGGASASDTLSISGATGAVTLTASNVPTGVTVTFSPNPTSTGSSTMTVSAASTAAAVTNSPIMITATAGTLKASTTVMLNVTGNAPPPPPGGCHIGYTISNQWNTGFQVALSINNTSTAPINGWTLTWSFANGQTITQLWNGQETQSGANVTVKNLNYNASIPAGGSYTAVGFTANWNGTNSVPTAFTLNGTACN
jgi:endo-1,4-beta-xylanase